MASPNERSELAQKWIVLERLAVLLLLFAGMVPRGRHLEASFDTELDGARAASHAIAAVNYERLGPGAGGGFPLSNRSLPTRLDRFEGVGQAPWAKFVELDQPPLSAWLAWSSLRTLGTDDWATDWLSDPGRNEFALRFPFLLAHLAFLVALWWAAREAFGAQVGLLSLAFAIAIVPFNDPTIAASETTPRT